MNRMKLGPLAGLNDTVDSDSDKTKKSQNPAHPNDPLFPPFGLSKSGLFQDGDQPVDAIQYDPFHSGSGGSADLPEIRYQSRTAIHSCFLPVHYQSSYSYPLVVWLHSTGSSHRQLDQVMPMISDRNFVGVSLDGCQVLGERDSQRFGWLQSSESIEMVTNQVASVIDSACLRFNINSDRIFIAGQDSGGTMAFRVAFERPELFAGVISLNGSLPSTLNPLSNWRSCRGLPVFWSHGRNSVSFPETNLCHQLRLLHVAGFDVTLRQYPGDDCLPRQVYGDANAWIMERIAKQGASIIG